MMLYRQKVSYPTVNMPTMYGMFSSALTPMGTPIISVLVWPGFGHWFVVAF